MLDTIVLLGGALMVGVFFTVLALVASWRERRYSEKKQ
jgi:hypothetical protein